MYSYPEHVTVDPGNELLCDRGSVTLYVSCPQLSTLSLSHTGIQTVLIYCVLT